MLVLGVDCSTKITGVSLVSDGCVLKEINTELGRRQSSLLPAVVAELFECTRYNLKNVDVIAAANGPGYYTGIRTGVAYSAALALALGIKTVPVSSLEAFVFDLRHEYQFLVPVLKARNDSVYCAVYQSTGVGLNPVVMPACLTASHFAKTISCFFEKGQNIKIVGQDAALYDDLVSLDEKYISRNSAGAAQTALLGEQKANKAIPPAMLRGEYLRDPDIGPPKTNQ